MVSRKKTAAARRHVVRIIGGQWRGRKLPVPAHPDLRPTPDRVRETLFNWLGQDLAGWRVVDAFAGTGALGLEAASRGAAQVLLIEQEAQLTTQLQKLVAQLGAAGPVRVQRGHGVHVLAAQPAQSLDLILLDPPFDAPQLVGGALVAAARALQPAGFIYLECAAPLDDTKLAPHGLTLHKHLKAGAVHAHLLQKTADASA